MTSSAPHRYYRCNHRSKVLIVLKVYRCMLCFVSSTRTPVWWAITTKTYCAQPNMTLRSRTPMRKSSDADDQPYGTTPPGLRTSTPYKNQTAFVVGSWSHDRRNTRTEQTKLAGSMWRARKRIIHLLARPKQNFDHGQTKKCAKRLSSISLKSRKQQ